MHVCMYIHAYTHTSIYTYIHIIPRSMYMQFLNRQAGGRTLQGSRADALQLLHDCHLALWTILVV